MFGQLIPALLLGAASQGWLHVDTVPPGLHVWVNGTAKGVAPVTIEGLATGLHSLRAMSRHIWGIQPVDTTIYVRPGMNRLVLISPGTLRVICEGAVAAVEEDGHVLGHTPLLISRETSGLRRMRVRSGDAVLHEWHWAPIPGAFTTVSIFSPPIPERAPSHAIRGPVIATAASAAMAVAAAVMSRSADNAFDAYASTADPHRGRQHFRRAQRLDRWASGFWAGFQISALTALVWWIVSP